MLKKTESIPNINIWTQNYQVSLRFITKSAVKDILKILVHIELKLLARMILGTLKLTLCKKFHFMAGG
jgi:spore coat protein CotF